MTNVRELKTRLVVCYLADMILIADSGSTKCDWKLLEEGREIGSATTSGFNPFFHRQEEIVNIIGKAAILRDNAERVANVHVYCAGCSDPLRTATVEGALTAVFGKAVVSVEHDVLGAALAACQGKPGIACILGTGSNACYFDGTGIREGLPSLGYILGDEGSGGWYGKKLLRDHLYGNEMPEGLRSELVRQGHDRDSVVEHLYLLANPNVYLASFMKLIGRFQDTDYVKRMLGEGMYLFLDTHVRSFSEYTRVPTNFVGSVAYHFQDALRKQAEKLGIRVGHVIQRPIDGLVAHHVGG